MIRAILVTSILTLFAVPALAQNTTAEEACHATEFIQENNLSAIYVGESAQVALNAQLGSMASCTVKLKLKPCLYTTVKRAGSYVEIYNRGQSLFNGLRMLFGILESTGWNYKVESSFLSISFSDVQFGDFVSNEITARSQFIFGGASMDLDKLQEIMKDEASWNELCSIGTMTEDNFKTAWDVSVKKREALDATSVIANDKEQQEKQRIRSAQLMMELGLNPSPPPISGSRKDPLAQSIKQFVARVRSCWVIPPGAKEANVEVVMQVELNQDGSLVSPPVVSNGPGDELFEATARSVIRALNECQNYSYFPADQYEVWRSLKLRFSPAMSAPSE